MTCTTYNASYVVSCLIFRYTYSLSALNTTNHSFIFLTVQHYAFAVKHYYICRMVSNPYTLLFEKDY